MFTKKVEFVLRDVPSEVCGPRRILYAAPLDKAMSEYYLMDHHDQGAAHAAGMRTEIDLGRFGAVRRIRRITGGEMRSLKKLLLVAMLVACGSAFAKGELEEFELFYKQVREEVSTFSEEKRKDCESLLQAIMNVDEPEAKKLELLKNTVEFFKGRAREEAFLSNVEPGREPGKKDPDPSMGKKVVKEIKTQVKDKVDKGKELCEDLLNSIDTLFQFGSPAPKR